MSQQFSLKWNNHMHIIEEFEHFLSLGIMVDVTLACDGQSLKAHKIVLSACSSFFRSLFLENPSKHPIVILKGVKYTELKAVIDFMYHGKVNVAQDQLPSLLKTAQTLKVKGLGEEVSECQRNDFPSDEYENLSGHESENQSEDELSNVSASTMDVTHEMLEKKQTMIDEDENFTPEIKKEILIDDTSHDIPYPGIIKLSLLSHPHKSNFSFSHQEQTDNLSNDKILCRQSFMQNSVGQVGSLPKQSFESSDQSDIQQHQEDNDNSSSSIVETSTRVHLSNNLTVDNQEPSTSSELSHESLQKNVELEMIPTKKPPKKLPSSESVQETPNLRKPQVITYHEESNSSIDLDENSENDISKDDIHDCKFCHFMSPNLNSLRRHYKQTNHDETGKCQHRDCTYVATSKSDFVHHIKSVHKNKKPYQCSICTYKTDRPVKVKKHIQAVHEGKKPFKCEKCNFLSSNRSNLNRHMIAIHQKGKKKEFSCHYCSYQSYRKDSLNTHLKIHSKKK